jgi:plastocyanin domain-containing protein
MENPWLILIQVLAAGSILYFLFFRKGRSDKSQNATFQRIELKLMRDFTPNELALQQHHPVELLIHRYDSEPQDELFEIEELGLYELLPARHTTIIRFTPEKRGRFPLVLAGEREAGWVVVE